MVFFEDTENLEAIDRFSDFQNSSVINDGRDTVQFTVVSAYERL